jgi:hypothetical protein
MGLKVIGAGFGRTGTDSMREALNMLGFGPCHHMFEVTNNPVMKARWREFMVTDRPDWDALFEGYNSCVDWPAAHYWRELIAVYPEAKVILTWRPAADWWVSFSNTILNFTRTMDDPAATGVKIVEKTFGTLDVTREVAIAAYEANVAAVKAEVPAERLLVHSLGDGWAPLCRFLGVPVPDAPYPSRNSTAEITERVKR